jgi:hypothetical protein
VVAGPAQDRLTGAGVDEEGSPMASVGSSIGPPDRAVIPPTVLAAVLDIGRREGLSVPSWLSGAGLDPGLLYAPGARVSLQQARTVLHRALAAMPGRALGLDVGERDVLLSFGLLGRSATGPPCTRWTSSSRWSPRRRDRDHGQFGRGQLPPSRGRLRAAGRRRTVPDLALHPRG